MKIFTITYLLFLVISCSSENPSTPVKSAFDDDPVEAAVTWIYDGDTFQAAIGSEKAKIRVLYIDCYEMTRGSRLTMQAEKAGITEDSALALAQKATNFAIKILKDKTVILKKGKYEPDKDIYGRFLRTVTVDGMAYDSLLKDIGFLVPNK